MGGEAARLHAASIPAVCRTSVREGDRVRRSHR